jgi:protein-tyrosine phosphatase
MPARLIDFEGTLNFRDLGGYPTRQGGSVRWGRAFRSDSLSRLSASDWERFAALGIRTIVDLRRPAEIEAAPTRLPDGLGVKVVRPAATDPPPNDPELLGLVLSGRRKRVDTEEVCAVYCALARDYARAFGATLATLAQGSCLPAVVHCTAGKDRTGLAAALLLLVLGVDEEVVLDDYELSTTYRSGRRMAELAPVLEKVGVRVRDVTPLLSAPRPALAGALAWVRRSFGSVESYLTGPGGLDPSCFGRLRQLLVGPA